MQVLFLWNDLNLTVVAVKKRSRIVAERWGIVLILYRELGSSLFLFSHFQTKASQGLGKLVNLESVRAWAS